MRREQYLRSRLHRLQTLNEAVSAMKALSAHHFRLSRQALPAARIYREQIETVVAEVGVRQEVDSTAPPGLLLLVSDLGLCGDYNTRLVQTAVREYPEGGEGLWYCVGRRPRAVLARYDIKLQRLYHAPASVAGLPGLLLQLAQDMLDDFLRQQIGSLFVASAQFAGAGRFAPVITQVLPLRNSRPAAPLRPTHYQTHRHLAAVVGRELLYTTLHELLLDALASEHGMRLLAAESARQWLDDTAATVRRQLAASRREATTQEVLDVVAGTRPYRRKRSQESSPGGL